MQRQALIGFLLCAAAAQVAAQPELTAQAETEWAYGYREDASQKWTFTLLPELRDELAPGIDLTLRLRVRWDAEDRQEPGRPEQASRSRQSRRAFSGSRAELELREAYIATQLGDGFLTLGKQQVVWGKADGLKVLDVVNPQSFREFILDDFDDSRIPLWAVNLEWPVHVGWEGGPEDLVAQFLWIPDPTAHEIPDPGAVYAFTSPRIVPRPPPGIPVRVNDPDLPASPISDSDWGGRLTAFWNGWDLSLNYLYRYNDTPILFRRQTTSGIEVTPDYRRSHLLGGSFSNAFGDLTVRGEMAWTSDAYFPTRNPVDTDGVVRTGELGSVLGLDWFGFSDTLLSLQVFNSALEDGHPGLRRARYEQSATFLLRRSFWNDTLVIQAQFIYAAEEGDSLSRLKLAYDYSDALELWAGIDVFNGDSAGLFGQFDRRDRLVTGFRYGF